MQVDSSPRFVPVVVREPDFQGDAGAHVVPDKHSGPGPGIGNEPGVRGVRCPPPFCFVGVLSNDAPADGISGLSCVNVFGGPLAVFQVTAYHYQVLPVLAQKGNACFVIFVEGGEFVVLGNVGGRRKRQGHDDQGEKSQQTGGFRCHVACSEFIQS